MADPRHTEPSVTETTTEARAGSTPGVARNVLVLGNLFLSQMRRARFKGEWDDITASKILAALASQDRHIELGDMQRALMHLPQPQREALILVGAGGFAYEEAAEICGCAVGTIKSRVARGRVALEQLLSSGKLPSRRQHRTDPDKSALQAIIRRFCARPSRPAAGLPKPLKTKAPKLRQTWPWSRAVTVSTVACGAGGTDSRWPLRSVISPAN